jgi:hypothetical protein
MEAYEHLKSLVAGVEEDLRKAEGGNMAAGTRVRKTMQENQGGCPSGSRRGSRDPRHGPGLTRHPPVALLWLIAGVVAGVSVDQGGWLPVRQLSANMAHFPHSRSRMPHGFIAVCGP